MRKIRFLIPLFLTIIFWTCADVESEFNEDEVDIEITADQELSLPYRILDLDNCSNEILRIVRNIYDDPVGRKLFEKLEELRLYPIRISIDPKLEMAMAEYVGDCEINYSMNLIEDPKFDELIFHELIKMGDGLKRYIIMK